jgi:hypothetical protein
MAPPIEPAVHRASSKAATACERPILRNETLGEETGREIRGGRKMKAQVSILSFFARRVWLELQKVTLPQLSPTAAPEATHKSLCDPSLTPQTNAYGDPLGRSRQTAAETRRPVAKTRTERKTALPSYGENKLEMTA